MPKYRWYLDSFHLAFRKVRAQPEVLSMDHLPLAKLLVTQVGGDSVATPPTPTMKLENIARIAKAVVHKLLGKLSRNSQSCLSCLSL